MRTYRGPEGDERIWFDEDEIETIMEDELRRAGLMPTDTASVTDLEAFIEDHLKASLEQYADLDQSVLGLTEFLPGKPPAVRINRALSEATDSDWCPPGVHGRWRATLAHEAAHIVLHRMLFDADLNQLSMFNAGPPSDDRLFRCKKADVVYRNGSSDWREVQANRGMASLLMPKRLFAKIARHELAVASSADPEVIVRVLATRFGVSREAAAIRLRTLKFNRPDGQLFDA